jgi:hypothetical protein
MRTEDLEKLRVPLGNDEPLEAGFARAIGVEVPAVRRLYQEMFSDLDEEMFGVRWWATHVGPSRRILISHHLVECVTSVETNLVEASLHLLEAADYWQQEGAFWADVIARRPDGRLEYQSRRRASPVDDLPRRLATLHAVGFVRAIGSVLDCLGACIIGVLALRKNLLLADFWKAKNALEKAIVGETTPGRELHRHFYRVLDIAIADAGPAGWVDWLFDLRNMVVHRGRRLHMTQILPRPERIFGADNQVIPRMMAVEQLPSDPALSQVESFVVVDHRPPVLTEHAELTLRGIRKSTLDLTTVVMRELVDAWRMRRQTPGLLIQSAAQWPEGRSQVTSGFVGYRAGSLPYDPTEMRTDRDTMWKFRTAALDDDTRGRWASFE